VDTFKPELTCVAELKRHEKPVNVVRFSPDGTFIATGGDGNLAYYYYYKSCGLLLSYFFFLQTLTLFCGNVGRRRRERKRVGCLRNHYENILKTFPI
jgi:hypothetical protein